MIEFEAMLIPRITRRSLFLGSAVLHVGSRNGYASATNVSAIVGATVINGKGDAIRDSTVVWRGDRIETVGNARETPVPRGARVLDGRRRFVVPGLWDMHVHLSVAKASSLSILLANGITTVRDMGGRLDEIDRWKAQIAAGSISGPRIFRAGPIVNAKVFNELQIAVEDRREAHGAVRALHAAGVDFIKVHAAMSRDAYVGVKEECDRLAIRFAGHLPRAIAPSEASDAKQASVEHLYTLFEGTLIQGLEPSQVAGFIHRFRSQGAPELFARFAQSGVALTPTLGIDHASQHLLDEQPPNAVRYNSLAARKATQFMRARYRDLFTRDYLDRQKRLLAESLPLIPMMQSAGVSILAGTDMGSSLLQPGFSLHQELAHLVDAGLSPMNAILSATRNPAQCLSQPDLGVIENGKVADLVILTADPLLDIRNTQQIHAVVSGGRIFDRRALDAILTSAQQAAQNEGA